MNEKVLSALVIDDNEVNTIVLANMLELFNISADQANDGYEAIEMVRQKDYSIIFVDHVMPKMDGAQATKAIRNLSPDTGRIIIIALTSSITEEIRKLYQCSGANEVYSKPLGLLELATILKQWCPNLPADSMNMLHGTGANSADTTLIKAMVHEISEINYDAGIRYALGDPNHYVNILKISLKDVRTCLNLVMQGYEKQHMNDMRIGVHNMKSVFANIGAIGLAELAKDLEQQILKLDSLMVDQRIEDFMKYISDFYSNLELALNRYDNIINAMLNNEDPSLPMTREEYEQSILNTIYYIKRFDYSAILGELELLIKRGNPEYRTQLELALSEMKDYQYESTLLRLTDIKKEMDKHIISEF